MKAAINDIDITEQDATRYLEIVNPRLYQFLFHHRNRSNQPMAVQGKEWVIPFMADECPNITVRKCVQIGFTEIAISDILYYANQGLSCMYLLPNDDSFKAFIPNRLDPLLAMVPRYRAMCEVADARKKLINKPGSNSLYLKEIGEGVIKLAGTNSAAGLQEFPCSVLFIDEYAFCNMDNLNYAIERTQGASHPIIRKFSRPTIADSGIDAEYQRSDQREYYIPCNHCNHFQPLRWEESVVIQDEGGHWVLRDSTWDETSDKDINPICIHCSKPFDRIGQMKHGEWVAAFPSRDSRHGYTLGQMNSPKTIRELWEEFRDIGGDSTKLGNFYNARLGVPFSAAGDRLTIEDLNQCKGDYVLSESHHGPCFMGVDVGSILNVMICSVEPNGDMRTQCIATCRHFDDLDDYMTRYNVFYCVIDARPEIHLTRQFAEKWNGRVLRCDFVQSEIKGCSLDRKNLAIQVNRTQVLDGTTDEIRQRRLILPRDADKITGFYDQMVAPARVREKDASGRERFVWREGSKADHYRFAFAYMYIAATILNSRIKYGTIYTT